MRIHLYLVLWVIVPPASGVAASNALTPGRAGEIAARIDSLIQHRLIQERIPPSPVCNDAEFLRRAALTLTGQIPAVAATESFLTDQNSEKRRQLIDRLLQSEFYGQHFANTWNRLFTGRETGMARPPDTRLLRKWLVAAFNQNRSWNQLAREILTASGTHGEQPATIFFTLHGNSRGIPEPNVITNAAGTLFLGIELQCAECHDHPFRRWSQQDYWGLAAFFSRVKDSGNKGGVKRWIRETAREPDQPVVIDIPAASFTNVGTAVEARLPDTEVDLSGTVSPRQAFAAWATSSSNPWFARNLANRIWAHCFGRGLLHPLDGFTREAGDASDSETTSHSTPAHPTHPEVLDLLASELTASGFDQHHLLRCICLSEAWQRTSRALPENEDDTLLYSHRSATVLSSEMLADSLSVAWGSPVLSDTRPKMNFRNPLLPLYSPREKFVRLFRTLPKDADHTQYTHGVPQLLFLMNSPALNRDAPVVTQLLQAETATSDAIEHLYHATLTRPPTAEELTAAADFVASLESRRDGLEGVLWTLLNRSEFIINH